MCSHPVSTGKDVKFSTRIKSQRQSSFALNVRRKAWTTCAVTFLCRTVILPRAGNRQAVLLAGAWFSVPQGGAIARPTDPLIPWGTDLPSHLPVPRGYITPHG